MLCAERGYGATRNALCTAWSLSRYPPSSLLTPSPPLPRHQLSSRAPAIMLRARIRFGLPRHGVQGGRGCVLRSGWRRDGV